MLFNSPEFLFIFLPLVLGMFLLLLKKGKGNHALTALLVSSLIFYGWWNPLYLFLLLGSVLANYLIGHRLSQHNERLLLVCGIAGNLSLIAIYKYAGFFVTSLNILGTDFTVPAFILPLAISFFTFQQIAYLVDCWRGEAGGENLRDYALFVTFFPQLIAGPIVHHREMMPQYRNLLGRDGVRTTHVTHGIFLLSIGLFKKVVIADTIASTVDPIFASAQIVSFYEAWTGALGYTLQLYFDFSGYSEMAMGLALLFGLTLPINFNSPYKALNIADFWRRWHVTLGRFIREYLYIPLGGSRNGPGRTLIALIVTMLLAGLWHGAGWTFVLWGGLHGLYLATNYGWQKLGLKMPALLAWSMTYLAVTWAWVLFRAASLTDAVAVWKSMLGLNGIVIPESLRDTLPYLNDWVQWAHSNTTTGLEWIVLLPLIYFVATQPNVHALFKMKFKPDWRWGSVTASAAMVSIAQLGGYSQFLYWDF